MRIFFIAAFFGAIAIFSLSVYSGFIEIRPQNLLGLVGIGDSNDFKFVGSVDLEDNSSTQSSDYFLENNKKIANAPVKTKKEKELVWPIVKVISGRAERDYGLAQRGGAAADTNKNTVFNNTASSSAIASATAPIVSSTPLLVLPVITTISSTENLASVQTSEENQEKTQEETLTQIPQIIQEPVIEQTQTQNNISPAQENISVNILISEIMAGADANSSYEFIELFNPTANSIDLTGWSIKKKSSTGSESTLVSTSRFEGKIIPANKYFLLANEGGYDGQISADVFWPKSYTLAYTNNAIIIYNSNNEFVEEVSWTEIPKGQSIERESMNGNQFKIRPTPNPQNSSNN